MKTLITALITFAISLYALSDVNPDDQYERPSDYKERSCLSKMNDIAHSFSKYIEIAKSWQLYGNGEVVSTKKRKFYSDVQDSLRLITQSDFLSWVDEASVHSFSNLSYEEKYKVLITGANYLKEKFPKLNEEQRIFVIYKLISDFKASSVRKIEVVAASKSEIVTKDAQENINIFKQIKKIQKTKVGKSTHQLMELPAKIEKLNSPEMLYEILSSYLDLAYQVGQISNLQDLVVAADFTRALRKLYHKKILSKQDMNHLIGKLSTYMNYIMKYHDDTRPIYKILDDLNSFLD